MEDQDATTSSNLNGNVYDLWFTKKIENYFKIPSVQFYQFIL